jgi:flagellar biosynthetic protein FliO
MGFSKTKKYAVWAALVWFSCTAFAAAKPFPSDAGEKSIFSNTGSVRGGSFNPEAADDNLNATLRKMTLAVLIVVALGVAVMYLSKKIVPKLSRAEGKKIKLIETVHLGSRKTIHLLEIAGQQILIGSTPDRITKLADIFSEKGFPLAQTDQEATE